MNTFVTKDGKHIVVPYHAGLAAAVPHAKPFQYNGQGNFLVMPNGPAETRLARNFGLVAPAPIETRYDWRGTKPWDIQKTTAAFLSEAPRAYVLSELGTGKTRAVLYAVDWLIRTRQARRVLVVAPLSTLTPVWEREIFKLMLPYKVSVLHGSKEKRLQHLADGAPICIINHHGVMVLGEALIRAEFDIVVVDELAVYRNQRTDMWKILNRVINNPALTLGPRPPQHVPRFVWGLTGSPTPNAPTDAWAQARLLTPHQAPRTFMSFRDQTMVRLSQFRWHPRPNANQVVMQAMSPSVRYLRRDIMELPDCMTVDRHAPLEAAAAKAYKMLYARARMMCEPPKNNESVTALNEGVLHNKLLQVSCGYIYTDTKTIYELPANSRRAALDEVLDETDHKVLVMVPFLHALAGVSDYLRAHHRDIAVVHGGTGRTARDVIFTDFQTKASPRIICAHPQTLAHGLTLTAANTIVWYSPTQSLEIYEQANARINRPGQRNEMLIVHLVGTEIERATYTRLKQKARMQGLLLDLFAEKTR